FSPPHRRGCGGAATAPYRRPGACPLRGKWKWPPPRVCRAGIARLLVLGKAATPFNKKSGVGERPHRLGKAPADRLARDMAAALDLPAPVHPDAIDRRAVGEDPAVEQAVAR